MKTISEKAKVYDEVVEKLSKLYRDYDSVSNLIDVKEELENILPEIKESKDERMCKVAIEACKYMVDNFENSTQQYTDAITWLEKQGEHAKFRDSIQVGDKVTRNRDGMLVNLSQLKRVAKPAENKGEHDMGISESTKQKLEDNLNKALEKETPESCNEFLDEQKPAWSEEDKKMSRFIGNAITAEDSSIYLKSKGIQVIDAHTWLEELKERVQQQQQEWSKEDDYNYGIIQYILNNECVGRADKEIAINWFKFLKDRYTWKPSDEQIKVCKEVYADILSAKGFDLGTVNGELNRLEEELKKLREE